jgi:hypothetical protein
MRPAMLRLRFILGLISAVVPQTARAQGACIPQVQARPAFRNLPSLFHDQALESLRTLYPLHEVLVARRTATLGQVEYGLVVYRETPSADSVHIGAVAVAHSGNHAWDLDATCPTAQLPDALVSTMEALTNLQ